MPIINDKQLLKDSVKVLSEYIDMPKEVIIKHLTPEVMEQVITEMYTAQESFLYKLGDRILKASTKGTDVRIAPAKDLPFPKDRCIARRVLAT